MSPRHPQKREENIHWSEALPNFVPDRAVIPALQTTINALIEADSVLQVQGVISEIREPVKTLVNGILKGQHRPTRVVLLDTLANSTENIQRRGARQVDEVMRWTMNTLTAALAESDLDSLTREESLLMATNSMLEPDVDPFFIHALRPLIEESVIEIYRSEQNTLVQINAKNTYMSANLKKTQQALKDRLRQDSNLAERLSGLKNAGHIFFSDLLCELMQWNDIPREKTAEWEILNDAVRIALQSEETAESAPRLNDLLEFLSRASQRYTCDLNDSLTAQLAPVYAGSLTKAEVSPIVEAFGTFATHDQWYRDLCILREDPWFSPMFERTREAILRSKAAQKSQECLRNVLLLEWVTKAIHPQIIDALRLLVPSVKIHVTRGQVISVGYDPIPYPSSPVIDDIRKAIENVSKEDIDSFQEKSPEDRDLAEFLRTLKPTLPAGEGYQLSISTADSAYETAVSTERQQPPIPRRGGSSLASGEKPREQVVPAKTELQLDDRTLRAVGYLFERLGIGKRAPNPAWQSSLAHAQQKTQEILNREDRTKAADTEALQQIFHRIFPGTHRNYEHHHTELSPADRRDVLDFLCRLFCVFPRPVETIPREIFSMFIQKRFPQFGKDEQFLERMTDLLEEFQIVPSSGPTDPALEERMQNVLRECIAATETMVVPAQSSVQTITELRPQGAEQGDILRKVRVYLNRKPTYNDKEARGILAAAGLFIQSGGGEHAWEIVNFTADGKVKDRFPLMNAPPREIPTRWLNRCLFRPPKRGGIKQGETMGNIAGLYEWILQQDATV